MIVLAFDTESTGLISNGSTPLDKQPECTEFYGCLVDLTTGEILEEVESLFRPQRPISAEITRITGIDDEMVKDAPRWADKADEIVAFLARAPCVLAHNASYDRELIGIEEKRRDRVVKWPRVLCGVEATIHYKGYRLSLAALHELLFNECFPEAHRAKNDVMALVRCAVELHKRGDL